MAIGDMSGLVAVTALTTGTATAGSSSRHDSPSIERGRAVDNTAGIHALDRVGYQHRDLNPINDFPHGPAPQTSPPSPDRESPPDVSEDGDSVMRTPIRSVGGDSREFVPVTGQLVLTGVYRGRCHQ